MIKISIPAVGESISEVTLLKWAKKEGDYAHRDDVIAEIESEKASFEISAEQAGVLKNMTAKEGETLKVGDVIAEIDTDVAAPASSLSAPKADAPLEKKGAPSSKETKAANQESTVRQASATPTPLAKAIGKDMGIDLSSIQTDGSDGRRKIRKDDILKEALKTKRVETERNFRSEKMSALRKTISRRLVQAKNTTAMLTTFNEADMSAIMELRKKYKDAFKEKHNVGLGFMSFFTRACCIALEEIPAVNAYLDEDSIIYHNYCDISIAVSSPKGLVVPVIRNADRMEMYEIEREVLALASKARDGKLSMEDMQGGTFTITNGGVFGSLLSTPIINPPQSAILGMHKIEERPIAINKKVEIRPMMYLALSYDHRIIDGRESVTFLARVKSLLENPLLLISGKDPDGILLGL